MTELTAWSWVLLGIGAAVIGLSKAALPGAGAIAVALFATALPAKQSTGTILLLLIAGDMFALYAYRRHADPRILVRLIPAVLVGLAFGTVFLAFASDDMVRRIIGSLLLATMAATLWRRRKSSKKEVHAPRVASVVYGTLGGFTTMVANAAGPVMSMYFLAMRLPVKTFLGTAAWFFAVVNIIKVPFSVGLGLITVDTLFVFAVLVPIVIAAAFIGRLITTNINQKLFDQLVIGLTIAGAIYLLLSP